MAFCSPARKQRMMGVASAVRVIPALIPAAKERHARGIVGIPGKMAQSALPNDAPDAKKGKIKHSRYPPATVKELATSFAKPTMRAWKPFSVSNPNRSVVGHTRARVLVGESVEIV
jgi:hypothetical protein